MKPASFKYFRPGSVSEALALLSENQDDCKILAGGQSLVPAMNFRLLRPAIIIDINELKELSAIKATDQNVLIGALTRHAAYGISRIFPSGSEVPSGAVSLMPIRLRNGALSRQRWERRSLPEAVAASG
jgi:CO/xanthine dehydrogenase FAD-binding subunit